MMKAIVGVIVSVMTVVGCAHGQISTSLPNSKAPEAFGYIGPLASAEGFRIYPQPDRLHVRYDEVTEIQYIADREFSPLHMMNIKVLVDDTKVGSAEAKAHYEAAANKAKEWLARANDSMMAAAAAPQINPETRPAPSSSPALAMTVDFSGPTAAPAAQDTAVAAAPATDSMPVTLPKSCQKLADCYARLEELLCAENGEGCKFKVEVAGMQESDCTKMVKDAPRAVTPGEAQETDFEMPAKCL